MAQNTYKQALVSTDADFLKKVCSSYKGRITRYINALQTALVKGNCGLKAKFLAKGAQIDQTPDLPTKIIFF